MSAVGQWLDAIAHIIVVGWLYFLTARAMRILTLGEQIVDRDHTVTLPEPYEPEPEWQPHEIELGRYQFQANVTQPIPEGPPTAPAVAVIADNWEQWLEQQHTDAMAALDKIGSGEK